MKKILSIIILALAVFSLSLHVFAIGDTNLDGGGGDMESGNNESYWNPGNEGVRVTVINVQSHKPVTTPIDIVDKPPSSNIYHFGKVSKIQYNNGTLLTAYRGGYTAIKSPQDIPTIISANGTNNIQELKKYFCSEFFVQLIANHTGMNYNTLISGRYKLLIEPLAFYKFSGVNLLTTATEAALYDQVVNGQLRVWMGALTHKNLPLSIFLETSDLGYPAWSGSTSSYATNANIISSLGIGIVKFKEEPKVEIETIDYEYRTNTEVITSVYVSGGQSDPDNPIEISFIIGDTTYNIGNVYYPQGESQIAWVKWTTPSKPQEMTIQVNVIGGIASQSTINVKIVDLDLNPPPNPTADDRNDDFTYSEIPSRDETDKLTWTVWTPTWKSDWVDTGQFDEDSWSANWVDGGDWIFECKHYYATIQADMEITPDTYNPTSNGSVFKSGYGINQTVRADVSSNQSSAVSKTPNAISYFPEFGYETYWRLLERIHTGYNSLLEFKENPYSTYKNRTHFTPIWMLDGLYTVNTHVLDFWCPTGMLSANLNDSLTIQGNLWQDWHTGPKK